MKNYFAFSLKRSALAASLLLMLASCSRKEDASPAAPAPISTTATAIGAAGIAGVNWADERDNFNDGPIVISGLTTSDTYATAQATAQKVVSGFQNNMGANTIRFGINYSSVSGTWWNTYTGAIDQALSMGSKVMLGYWEGTSSLDGRVDNTTQYRAMWQIVVDKYGSNPNVYFEPFNEPHGYTATDLKNLYADWLGRYPSIPKNRVVLDGTGYSTNVVTIGDDPRFNDCLLSVHNYTFFVSRDPAVLARTATAAYWEKSLAGKVGAYSSRTVLTEFGQSMTSGIDYTGPINAVPDNAFQVAYLQGTTNQCRRAGIASIYWPGLRTNDHYSLQKFDGTTMTTTSASGLSRIKYGYNSGDGGTDIFYPGAYYRIINRASGYVLDIPGSSTTAGTRVQQYAASGGNDQQWQVLSNNNGYYRLINRATGQAANIPGFSTANGAEVAQYPYDGGNNQQWQMISLGGGYYRIVNRHSGKVADLPASSTTEGTTIKQYPWNGGDNQQWLIIQQ